MTSIHCWMQEHFACWYRRWMSCVMNTSVQQPHHSCGKCLEWKPWVYFSLHIQGKLITCVVAHRSPSVYNVAFALHCPDPVTPKGNWFLPLCCPFTSLSSLIVFLFLLIPSSLFHSLPSHLFSRSFAHTDQRNQTSAFPIPPDHHPSLFFISFAPLPSSLPLAPLSCLFVLLLCAVSLSPNRSLLLDPSMIRPKFHLFPSVALYSSFSLPSLVFTPSICLIIQWFSFCLCALFVLTSTSFSCPPSSALFVSLTPSVIPSLLFSVCLCVLGPVLNPQLGWQMVYLSTESTQPSPELFI